MIKYIIQKTATAGLIVPHPKNPIFQYVFDCLSYNRMNGTPILYLKVSTVSRWLTKRLSLRVPRKRKKSNEIKSQLRGRQLTSISADYSIYKKKTIHKWPRSIENKCLPLQFLETKIRLAWQGNGIFCR